jgi:hypothetical protein
MERFNTANKRLKSRTRPPRKRKKRQRVVAPACPKCADAVARIKRTPLDRLLAAFRLTARYSCQNASCDWQGVVYGAPNRVALRITGLLLLLLASWIAAKVLPPIVEASLKSPALQSETDQE